MIGKEGSGIEDIRASGHQGRSKSSTQIKWGESELEMRGTYKSYNNPKSKIR